jgi:hypothetical protein
MHTPRNRMSTAVILLAALLTSGCVQEIHNSTLSEEQVQALVRRVQYLEDMNAIQKLQSQYVHSLFTQRYADIPALFAQNDPQVSVEFSDSGVFRGIDSVRELYGAFDRTRNVPGFFIMHMTVNPYIEIAGDGLSAKSHWLSPGASNSPGGSSWIWGPYYIDYVKENDEWRILHSNLVPLFRNPYEYSWNDAPHHGTVNVAGQLGLEPDEPSTLYRPFNEVKQEQDMFRAHPDLPRPF